MMDNGLEGREQGFEQLLQEVLDDYVESPEGKTLIRNLVQIARHDGSSDSLEKVCLMLSNGNPLKN